MTQSEKILQDRLIEFEKELEKEKSTIQKILVAVAIVATAINQGTGVITGTEDSIIKLPETIKSINILLGREKLAEIESAPEPLPLPSSVTKALPSPKPATSPATPRPGAFDDDLDDDVPF